MRLTAFFVSLACALLGAAPASAQVFRFERALTVGAAPTIDIATNRGGISVRAGAAGRVVVKGAVRVRIGVNVPVDAAARAQAVADQPPIEQTGDLVRLTTPADPENERAVTVEYEVTVPAAAIVHAHTQSGAVQVDGVQSHVSVETQSGAITLAGLGGDTEVTSGSGGVTIRGIGGQLRVTTSSGAITAAGLENRLYARAGSGEIDVVFAGAGDVDVRTQSSAITLAHVLGGASVHSNSGHIRMGGTPRSDWTITTGSSAIDVTLDANAPALLAASSASGKVKIPDGLVSGTVEPSRVKGTIGGGGPTVRLESRSGTITVR
jgi:hypothetical protein